jgi:glutamine amidotransferase
VIALVDMGLSNLSSVELAFRRVGAAVSRADSPAAMARAQAVVLPGVGAFGDGMAALKGRGLFEPLRAHALAGRPLLGICLGMQLLADSGEEHGSHPGLGLLPGRVVRLPEGRPGCRVPNMGWCDVNPITPRPPLAGLETDSCFYFAHSYHFVCDDPGDQAATLDFGGVEVSAAVQHENLLGVQFHPEKSQEAGLVVLETWLAMACGRGRA